MRLYKLPANQANNFLTKVWPRYSWFTYFSVPFQYVKRVCKFSSITLSIVTDGLPIPAKTTSNLIIVVKKEI